MNLSDKCLNVLEFDKILEMLSKECINDLSISLAKKIKPEYDIDKVRNLLKETDTACLLEAKYKTPAFRGIYDLEASLIKASFGASLSALELLRIASSLKAMRLLKNYRKNVNENTIVLDKYFDNLFIFKELEDEITNAIISEEEIADDASSELLNIRRKITSNSLKIRERLDGLIHSPNDRKYLQEQIITIRDGRFVIPVKWEFRNEIKGLIHDTSSSGATVFMEPMSVVNSNNEIKVLKSKEKEEIDRILMQLSVKASGYKDEILNGIKSFSKLEVIFAKANLAYKMKAYMPEVNDEGKIFLKHARHPLIAKEKVIATNINLGYDFDVLVITGPNTGGKTVSLKTVGLITLMAMSGFMIPADEGSKISVFSYILPDIGDEQSIEQSLSTFSSHIKNIVNIVETCTNKTLVLLDELGAGTDPIEGANLAIAILEHLKKRGAKTICTTHYAELKEYAITTQRVENACCEFDVETLRPTYKLLIGIPGKSNAFAISEKLGLNKEIVDNAKNMVSDENKSFEDVMRIMEEKRALIYNELKQAENLRLQSEALKEETERKIEQMLKSAENEVNLARNKASIILSQTRAQADIISTEIQKIQKNQSLTNEEKIALRSNIRKLEEYADPVDEKNIYEHTLQRPLETNDAVIIMDIDKKAYVENANVKKGMIQVRSGSMKLWVPLKNLKLIEKSPKPEKQSFIGRVIRSEKSIDSLRSIDLRGETVLDALMELDSFIDSCIMSKIHDITIIHGKGTGVLRKEVTSHLKRHPSVKSFRLGAFGEGESGVTIAQLK